MKTGIVTADPRKVCWKTYLYHGILMRCRVSCEPEPVKPFPIGPAWNPTTLDYEADCLPADNPDCMKLKSSHEDGTRFISDGVFYLKAYNGASNYIQEGWAWCTPYHFSEQLWLFAKFVPGVPPVSPWKSKQYSHSYYRVLVPFSGLTYVTVDLAYVSVYSGSMWGWKLLDSHYKINLSLGGSGIIDVPFSDVFFIHIWKEGGTWHFELNGTEYGTGGTSGYWDSDYFFTVMSMYFGVRTGIDYIRLWLDTTPS